MCAFHSSTLQLGTSKAAPVAIPELDEDDHPQLLASEKSQSEYANNVYDAINENALGRSYSMPMPRMRQRIEQTLKVPALPVLLDDGSGLVANSSYIGETEDNEWIKCVPHDGPPLEQKMDDERKDENKDIYNKLLSGMKTFRYQNP